MKSIRDNLMVSPSQNCLRLLPFVILFKPGKLVNNEYVSRVFAMGSQRNMIDVIALVIARPPPFSKPQSISSLPSASNQSEEMTKLSFVRPNNMNMNFMNAFGQAVPKQINSFFVREPAFLPFVPLLPQTPITTKNNTNNKGYQCTDDLLLPEDFQPSAYSVICGRGRKAFDAVGNRRLAVTASLFVKRYASATKKEEKTLIVSEILDMMRSACPTREHAFVRYVDGRWFRVQNLHAREKIGTVLRDSLHSKYKSSTKSKLAQRKLKKNNVSLSQSSSNITTTMKKKTCAKKKKSEPIASFSELSEEELDNIFA